MTEIKWTKINQKAKKKINQKLAENRMYSLLNITYLCVQHKR